MTDLRSTLIISLGANLPSAAGPPAATVAAAIAELPGRGIAPVAVSRFYRTPCFPAGAGPDYVNAALRATTRLAPRQVLAALHGIECNHGRNRTTRWGQRTLDLDLIAFDDLVAPDGDTLARWMAMPQERQRIAAPDRLILPHPRMHERAFVLVPAADVAPEWRHPVLGQTVRGMLAACDAAEIASITAL